MIIIRNHMRSKKKAKNLELVRKMQKQIKKEDKNIKENVKLKNHFDQTKIFKKEAKEVEMIKKMQKQLKKRG